MVSSASSVLQRPPASNIPSPRPQGCPHPSPHPPPLPLLNRSFPTASGLGCHRSGCFSVPRNPRGTGRGRVTLGPRRPLIRLFPRPATGVGTGFPSREAGARPGAAGNFRNTEQRSRRRLRLLIINYASNEQAPSGGFFPQIKGFFPGFWLFPARRSRMDALGGFACACAGLVLLLLLAAAHRLGLLYQLLHKADPKSGRHGGELVAEVLRAHGVRYLFALAGGHVSPVLVACEKLGLRVVDTRHEATAVFAADAVARLSGRIGVAVVTAGPGVTNTVTAVKNAQMAESPVLLLGGAAATLQRGRGALQEIDQLSLFKTLCKRRTSVRTVRDIVPALRQAIVTAQSGTPGPVFVELPLDVLYPFHVVEKELGQATGPGGLRRSLVNWYLRNYVHDLFAGAWEPCDMTPLPVQVPLATAEQVQQVAELVSRAAKPLVLLGSQVTLPPTPVEELRAALEALGLPCYLGGMARGLLGKDSTLHVRQNRRDALRQADLVILAGTVCDFRLAYGRVLSRRSAVVAVNRDRAQLLRNSDVFWKARLAIQGEGARNARDAGPRATCHVPRATRMTPSHGPRTRRRAMCDMPRARHRATRYVPRATCTTPSHVPHAMCHARDAEPRATRATPSHMPCATCMTPSHMPRATCHMPDAEPRAMCHVHDAKPRAMCTTPSHAPRATCMMPSHALRHRAVQCHAVRGHAMARDTVLCNVTPCCSVLCNATLCEATLRCVTLCCVRPCCTMPRHAVPSRFAVCAAPCRATLCHAMLHRATPRCVTPCCTVPHHAVSHHATPCHATLSGHQLPQRRAKPGWRLPKNRPPVRMWVAVAGSVPGFGPRAASVGRPVAQRLAPQTPVIALVGNDACWSQISREQVALLGSNVACGLEYTDYHAVAEGLGAKGFVVGGDGGEGVDAVLRAAQATCRQGRPVLVNALIGKSDFRQGSISV
nr:acetolactate synthase-like protein [Dromaius novaehollandiae]